MTHPTLILVHGAGHGPWCWEAVQTLLLQRGLETVALAMPSCADRIDELGGPGDDIRAVREACELIDGPKVLVGHSLGGMAVSEAAEGVSDIAHLIYVAGFMLDVGETVAGAASQWPPIGWAVSDDGRSVGVPDPARTFYGECSPQVAQAATGQLRLQDSSGAIRPLGGAAWRTIPTTYVICERDAVIPAEFQRSWAARVGTQRSLDTDHSPFLSQPVPLAEILYETAVRAGAVIRDGGPVSPEAGDRIGTTPH